MDENELFKQMCIEGEIEYEEELWRNQEMEEEMIEYMSDKEFEAYRKERYGV